MTLDLKYDTPLCTAFLVALAERSRRLPLDLQLRCLIYEAEAADELCETLIDLMPRVRSLNLSAPELTSKPWSDLLSAQAPILEYARLGCIFEAAWRGRDARTLSPGLFGGYAPALRHICLDGVQLAPIGNTLALRGVDSFSQLRVYTFDAAVLRPILRACPGLRRLTALPTMHYKADGLAMAFPPECLPHTLWLSGRSRVEEVVQQLCGAIPGLRAHVSFLANEEHEDWSLTELLLAHDYNALPISLSIAWTPTHAWKREGDTSSSVLALHVNGQPVAFDVSLGLFSAALKRVPFVIWVSHLTALAAPSDIWYAIAQCHLPHLRELELFLPMDPCWPLDAQSRIYEPLALTLFRLTAESPIANDAQCGVRVKDVLEFLRTTISLKTLTVLVLRGVTVLADGDPQLTLPASILLQREDRPAFPWDVAPEPWCMQFPEKEAVAV